MRDRSMHPDVHTITKQATDGVVIQHSTQLEQIVLPHVLEAANYKVTPNPSQRLFFNMRIFQLLLKIIIFQSREQAWISCLKPILLQ